MHDVVYSRFDTIVDVCRTYRIQTDMAIFIKRTAEKSKKCIFLNAERVAESLP